MKAWVQRVTEASVTIDGAVAGEIGTGFLVLLGVTHTDTKALADKVVERLLGLRVFEDEAGKMNRDLAAVDGSILLISQFTLYADTMHGHRPGFSAAAPRAVAEPLYEYVRDQLRAKLGAAKVPTGRFGADMKVRLLNDGPVSVEIRVEV